MSATPWWLRAVTRSSIWLGGAICVAYFKKPEGASILAVRRDAVGWLGAGIVLAGLAGHVWSNGTLARGESRQANPAPAVLVTDGPFRYVRNPIYLAGIMLLFGVGVLYSPWGVADLAAPLVLFVYFHLRVVLAEEPALRRQVGPTFDQYCRRVPRWLPGAARL